MREPPMPGFFRTGPSRRTLLDRLLVGRDGRPISALRRALFHASGKPRGVFRRWVLNRDRRPRRLFAPWMMSEDYLSLPWPASRRPPHEAPTEDIGPIDPRAHPLRQELLNRLDRLTGGVRP